MRYIKEISSGDLKIGLYQWNNKYIVKIESGMYEQTYKIDDYEITDLSELESCFDEAFLAHVRSRFEEMHRGFYDSLQRNNVIF